MLFITDTAFEITASKVFEEELMRNLPAFRKSSGAVTKHHKTFLILFTNSLPLFVNRQISTYGKYFNEFYSKSEKDLQDKIDWVFELVKAVEHIPKKYFKHIESTDGVYEIRVEFRSNIYRILCFFDEGNLVVLINSFQKKSQKTPKQEIELAKKLKKQYFIDKKLKAENEKRNRKNIK